MFQTVENILYIGHNIQLAQTMLDFSSCALSSKNYKLDHFISADDLELILASKEYHYFICDVALSHHQVDKIKTDFPHLKTTYLYPSKIEALPSVMQGVISEDVKAALDYLNIPIYFKNIEGQFLACNSHFLHLVGMTSTQVIGKTAADVLPAQQAKEIEKLDRKLFSNNKVYLHESTLQDLSGKNCDVVFRKERVANSNIQIGIIFDVTDINAARLALDKERIMLRATTDISTDLIFFKDLQGAFLGCNKQFEKFVGCPEKDIIGKSDDQLFEFYQAVMCQEQDRNVMDNKSVYLGEEYLTYNNGERHFIEMRKEALQDAHGVVQGLIGVGRDITAYDILQKRLKIADTVFENSRECLLVTDSLGNILSANKALCEVTGYSQKELINANVSLFSSNQSANVELGLQQKQSWQGELSYYNKKGDVGYAWLEVYIVAHAEEGVFNRIYSFINLSGATNSAEEKIQHLATYDSLTGLFNRIALFARLEDALTRSEFKEATMAVVLIDINGFKEINDQYGHNAGDSVLKEVATRLKFCVLEKDTVARFGNHEFVIIVDELASEQDAAIVARKVAEQFDRKFIVSGTEVSLSAAIGIAMCPDDGMEIDALVDSAEEAKLRAKSDSGTSYHFYTPDLTSHSKQQFELEKELQLALELQQFELYFRPQYDIKSRQVVAVEALLRWNHPLRGVLHPDNFIMLADSTGLSVPIYMFILGKAANQAKRWHDQGIHFGRICLELSLLQLEDIHFIGELQSILAKNKCSPQWLEFAVDETIFANVDEIVHDNLLNISKLGVAIMVDNYAADRPALDFLIKFGLQKLKLAKHYRESSSVRYFSAPAVVNALMTLGGSLGVSLVSEATEIVVENTFPTPGIYDSQEKSLKGSAMKASEATFYLRCNKRK